ncbi:MAG TPA: cellulose-binding protein, partial [Polyangiaceae bacterium]|nr:cellulose-binding protein [Polyangiaceae bacterium]
STAPPSTAPPSTAPPSTAPPSAPPPSTAPPLSRWRHHLHASRSSISPPRGSPWCSRARRRRPSTVSTAPDSWTTSTRSRGRCA